MSRFAERVALVTGGGSGIGAATALRLAQEGAAVVLFGRSQEALDGVAARIRDGSGTTTVVAGDARSRADVEAAVAAAVERYGRLDILVTSHGSNRDRMAHRMSEEEWEEVIDTHLTGTFRCAQAARGAIAQHGGGRMVFVSSAAIRGSVGQANYSAAKGAITALVRTLALEFGPSGITVNSVIPGFIDTEMTRALAERTKTPWQELERTMADRNALRRIGTPADVAGVIAFLCGEDAAFVTGQNIWVRGGP
jgi:3-oxoacyl-[acyl-carrier protein] reductase